MARRGNGSHGGKVSGRSKTKSNPPPYDPDLDLITERERKYREDDHPRESAPGVPTFDPDPSLITEFERKTDKTRVKGSANRRSLLQRLLGHK